MLSSLRPYHDDHCNHRISPSEIDNDDSESIELPSNYHLNLFFVYE